MTPLSVQAATTAQGGTHDQSQKGSHLGNGYYSTYLPRCLGTERFIAGKPRVLVAQAQA